MARKRGDEGQLGRRSKSGQKQGQNTAKRRFSAPEPRAERSAKEFFNTLSCPYSITYCSSVTGPGNAPSPKASRMRCHKPCFSHNS